MKKVLIERGQTPVYELNKELGRMNLPVQDFVKKRGGIAKFLRDTKEFESRTVGETEYIAYSCDFGNENHFMSEDYHIGDKICHTDCKDYTDDNGRVISFRESVDPANLCSIMDKENFLGSPGFKVETVKVPNSQKDLQEYSTLYLNSFDYSSSQTRIKQPGIDALAPSRSSCQRSKASCRIIHDANEHNFNSSSSSSNSCYESAEEDIESRPEFQGRAEGASTFRWEKLSSSLSCKEPDYVSKSLRANWEKGDVSFNTDIGKLTIAEKNLSRKDFKRRSGVEDKEIQAVPEVNDNGVQCNLLEENSKKMEEEMRKYIHKKDREIRELQDRILSLTAEHRKEMADLQVQLNSRLTMNGPASTPYNYYAQDFQPSYLVSAEASPSVNSRDVYEPTEIIPKKEFGAVPKRRSDEPKENVFYEMEPRIRNESAGSDVESKWSSRSSSPGRGHGSKAQELMAKVIKRVLKQRADLSEEEIKRYFEKFRQQQSGLTGMKINAIVAGILGLIKSESLI